MVTKPAPPCDSFALAPGVRALPGGFALLEASRSLLCADAHLGYENVAGGGGALPLWSTAESIAAIELAAHRWAVREVIFLGDAIHANSMTAGAARVVAAALAQLRTRFDVTVVAGNHEGRSRGAAVLGATVEACERDGWMLVHGDRPVSSSAGAPTIIGHLHPSLHLGSGVSVPAFVAATRLVVVPAVTPYSTGLDVLGHACRDALAAWGAGAAEAYVVAATAERVYPFGALRALRTRLGAPRDGPSFENRRRLQADPG